MEMASALSIFPSPTLKSSLSSLYNSSSSSTGTWVSDSFSYRHGTHSIRASSFNHSHIGPPILNKRNESIYPSLHHFSSSFNRLICKAEYKFPDPIPEFAETVSTLYLYVIVCVCLGRWFILCTQKYIPK